MFPKEISVRNKKSLEEIEKILEDHFGDILILIKKKKIKESEIKHVLENLVDGKSLKKATTFEKIKTRDVGEKIHKIIKKVFWLWHLY